MSARRLKTAEDGAGSAVSEHIDCNSPPGVRARSRVARAAARILLRGACVRSQIASPRIAGPKHDMQDDLHVRCRPTAGAEAAGGSGHPGNTPQVCDGLPPLTVLSRGVVTSPPNPAESVKAIDSKST